MRRGTVLVAAVLLAVACNSPSTTAPSPSAPLAAGAYVFAIAAPDGRFVAGQLADACPGAGPAGLATIQANAIVEVAGGESRVRPASAADGAFEMGLTSTAATTGRPPAARGWIRGAVQNTIFPPTGPAADARATFTADATVEGEGSAVLLGGTVTGSLTVSNANGVSVSCLPGMATWSLSRILR